MDWLAIVKRKNILIIRTEDMSNDIAGTLKTIYRFLDLPQLGDEIMEKITRLPRKNEGIKSKPMLPETKKLLIDFYRPYNKMLVKLLGSAKFSWQELH